MLSKIECNGNDRSVAQSASLLFAVQRDSLISPWLSSNDKKKKKNTITRIGLDRALWKHGRDGGR